MNIKQDWLILLAGFLGALKIFLSSVGLPLIPDETINSLVDMIGFGAALFAVYKNTYVVTEKARKQKEVLEDYDPIIKDEMNKNKAK